MRWENSHSSDQTAAGGWEVVAAVAHLADDVQACHFTALVCDCFVAFVFLKCTAAEALHDLCGGVAAVQTTRTTPVQRLAKLSDMRSIWMKWWRWLWFVSVSLHKTAD